MGSQTIWASLLVLPLQAVWLGESFRLSWACLLICKPEQMNSGHHLDKEGLTTVERKAVPLSKWPVPSSVHIVLLRLVNPQTDLWLLTMLDDCSFRRYREYFHQWQLVILMRFWNSSYSVLLYLSAFLFPTCLFMTPTAGFPQILDTWDVSAGKELQSPMASLLILQEWK